MNTIEQPANKRFSISGDVGENYDLRLSLGYFEAENSTAALDIAWSKIQAQNTLAIKREDLNSHFSVREEPLRSRAYQILDSIYNGSWSDGGKSWTRLNHALWLGLKSAIICGITFDINDFSNICRDFKGGYWFSSDGGESFYTLAIENNNLSACQSFEAFRSRQPFTLENNRIHVGYQFNWIDKKGKSWVVRCTSFHTSGESLTACNYVRTERKSAFGTSYDEKVFKRFTITQEDLKQQRALLKEKNKVVKENAEMPG